MTGAVNKVHRAGLLYRDKPTKMVTNKFLLALNPYYFYSFKLSLSYEAKYKQNSSYFRSKF